MADVRFEGLNHPVLISVEDEDSLKEIFEAVLDGLVVEVFQKLDFLEDHDEFPKYEKFYQYIKEVLEDIEKMARL